MRLLNITTIIGLLILALSSPAQAERSPRSMGADVRVRQVTYSPIDVVRIDTHLRVNTAIELGNSERISQVLLGDSESFEVEVLSNRHTISVKPVVARASSNMTIYTNRRAIAFYLTEGRTNSKTYRVVVNFPKKPRPSRSVATGPRDVAYQFAGNANFRPVRVWNNGRHTYMEFPNDTRPSVFGVNGSGYETTTNSVTRGRIIRLSGIQSEYSIKIGDEVVCVRRVESRDGNDPQLNALLASKEF